ncbi:MAG: adenylate/guanylate cyclase domain-containing protein [Pseudomonadota bacterium]
MTDEFKVWLEQIGLGEFYGVLARNGIDFDVLDDLTETDLQGLGLGVGYRKRLLRAVRALKGKSERQNDLEPPLIQPNPIQEYEPRDTSVVELPKSVPVIPKSVPSSNGMLVEQLTSGGERRQVSILFADLTGYTTLSAELDPEELQDVMTDFFRVTDAAIEANGGTVDKHLGDGVMALFGAPVSYGDDTSRAVRSASDIHAGLRDVSSKLGRELSSHIGIASGEVLAGAGTNQYTVIGDAVNLASRLSDMAKAHETYLSNEVYSEVSHETVCEQHTKVAIKGLEDVVTVWKVVGERDQPIERNALPFVGRMAERNQFQATIEEIPRRGSGAAFIFRGEPGIGKTRLATECLAVATSQGFASHHVLVLDFGGATGTDPLRSLFRSLLSVNGGATPVTREDAARKLIQQPGFEADDEAFIYDLLGLEMSEQAEIFYRAIENTARNRRKADLLGRALHWYANDKPQILLIEDLHWADPVTRDLCASLVARCVDFPAVVLMTSRIEGDPFDQVWRAGTGSTPIYTVDLRPLTSHETMELAAMTGADQAEVLTAEMEKAGGNPLFLEMMIRSSADSQTEALSGNLRSMVQARIDRLDPDDRRAIQAASIAGQRFDLELVRHLIDDPEYQLTGLLERSLVHPMGEQFLFAHALVQEGIYASVTKRNVQAMHLKAAEWYSAQDLILHAEHLAKAEDERAARAYFSAANALVGSMRFETAKELLSKGLEFSTDKSDSFDICILLGKAAIQTADQDAATEAYQKAKQFASNDQQRCEARLGVALSYRDRPHIPDEDVREELDEAERLAVEIGSANGQIESLYLRSYRYGLQSKLAECYKCAEKAVQLARPLEATGVKLKAYEVYGAGNYQLGRMRSAIPVSSQLLELAREVGSKEAELVAHYQLCGLYYYSNQFEKAVEFGQLPIDQAERFGFIRAAILGNEFASRSFVALGLFEEARRCAENSLRIAEAASMRARVSLALVRLSEIDRLEEKIASFDTAQRAVDLADSAYMRPWAIASAAIACSVEAERKELFAAADDLLDNQVCTGHNHFHVREIQIEDARLRHDWGAVEVAADKLETFTGPEPLPWTEFQIGRARVIAKWGREQQDDAFDLKLAELRNVRRSTGMKIWLPGD